MAIILADDGYVVLDESQGLQNTAVATATEDNDDNDISSASLPSAFSTRLFDAGELNLSTAFALANGVAQNDFISLTDGSTLTGFVMSSGDPLLAYEGGVTDPTTGVLAGFTTVDGEAIYLFADQDSGLGASMFLGVDASGDIVLAGYLEADGTISTVQFEAISNPGVGDHDDPVDLSGLLDVAASGTIDFDFDDLPSSNNLFATLDASPDGPAIVIFGADIHLQADGTADQCQRHDVHVAGGIQCHDRHEQPDVQPGRRRVLRLCQRCERRVPVGLGAERAHRHRSRRRRQRPLHGRHTRCEGGQVHHRADSGETAPAA